MFYITRIFYDQRNLIVGNILCLRQFKRKVTNNMSRNIIRKLNCRGFEKSRNSTLTLTKSKRSSSESLASLSQRGFQTHTLKSLCDLLAIIESQSDWLRAPSSNHQFLNPSWLILKAWDHFFKNTQTPKSAKFSVKTTKNIIFHLKL